MAIKVSGTSETNPDGGGSLEPGRYHVSIESLEMVPGKADRCKVALSVLASDGGSMPGAKHTEYFGLVGKSANRFFHLACAAGIMDKNTWKRIQESGEDADFDEEDLIGASICISVKLKPYGGDDEKYKGKEFPDVGFNIWSPYDEAVIDWPKDLSVLQEDLLPKPKPAPNGSTKPGTSAKQPGSSANAGTKRSAPNGSTKPTQAKAPGGSRWDGV